MGKDLLTDHVRRFLVDPWLWLGRRSAHWFRWVAAGIAAAAAVALMVSDFWELAASKSLAFGFAYAAVKGPVVAKQCNNAWGGGPPAWGPCQEPAFDFSIRTVLAVAVVGIIACLYMASRRAGALADANKAK